VSVTVESSGTQTAVIGTEHTLFDTAAAGTRTLFVDATNLVSGDIVEIRIYKMAKSAGSRLVTYFVAYRGAQPADDLGKHSVAVWTGLTDSGALRFTLKQVAGTGRAFDWTVEKQ
jgi:hypothetical protein